MMRIRPRTPDYKNGILDPTSKVGRGLITEILVGKVLGNPEGQCNFVHKFNYKYDMYNPKYGTVDVKSSAFRNGRLTSYNINTYMVFALTGAPRT